MLFTFLPTPLLCSSLHFFFAPFTFCPSLTRLTSDLCRGVSTSADLEREPLGVEAGERGQWPVGEADSALRGPAQVRGSSLFICCTAFAVISGRFHTFSGKIWHFLFQFLLHNQHIIKCIVKDAQILLWRWKVKVTDERNLFFSLLCLFFSSPNNHRFISWPHSCKQLNWTSSSSSCRDNVLCVFWYILKMNLKQVEMFCFQTAVLKQRHPKNTSLGFWIFYLSFGPCLEEF